MRFLFTGPGSAGHVFPMVPTAQALRAAGHEVLIAGPAPADLLRNTGLPVVELGGESLKESFRRVISEGGYVADGSSQEEIMRRASLGFSEHGRSTIPALLELARSWRPDVLVHAAFQAGAPLVAAKLGLPTVVHNFGPSASAGFRERFADVLAGEYERHGVAAPVDAVTLDVVPKPLGGDGTGWRMRYVPYNGGGTVPADLLGRGERPRIAVTLGTVLADWDGLRAITGLVRQAAGVDAEFLLAVGGADPGELGELPSNVRLLPWVPLAELLSAADAVVHHGGSGTMLTAAVAGVPQLILPQGADHFVNADLAAAAGFALRSTAEEVDGALLDRLLSDQVLRDGAAAVREEIAACPSPAELVADFERLAA